MNKDIIYQMTKIVETTMSRFQQDFYEHDLPYMEQEPKFPILWIVGRRHTFLLKLGDYEEALRKSQYEKYYVMNGNFPFLHYLDSYNLSKHDKIYIIEDGGVKEITPKQAREVVRDEITPILVKWEKENGRLTTRPVDVKLHDISFTKLKELIQECRNHNNNDSLMKALKAQRKTRWADQHKVDIYYEENANKFWCCETFNQSTTWSAIVFHGWPETGYLQNGSVQMEPSYGWSYHS